MTAHPSTTPPTTPRTPPEPTGRGHLVLSDLVKSYDPRSAVRAVDHVSLDIAPGEFVTLLGPSGCGKTTILRTVAGFEHPTSGDVRLDGADLASVPPNRRPVSMVFQSYALFPHLSVWDNVAYGLRAEGQRGRRMREPVDEVLETMGLRPYADRAPGRLSGGQQQRVALARAMVMRPRVMLFDEPLSNLDAALREQMRLEIRRLQRELGVTALYVTHDQSEAMAMADRIVVLNRGRVEQVGTPVEIYRRPATAFVADFIGRANLLPVRASEVGRGVARVSVLGEECDVPAAPGLTAGEDVRLLVRPESLTLRRAEAGGAAVAGRAGARGVVTATLFMGDRIDYEVDLDGQRLQASAVDVAEDELIAEGTAVRVEVSPSQCWLLPA